MIMKIYYEVDVKELNGELGDNAFYLVNDVQAEIDELVDMLEYFYEYGYERLKAERLLRKHKGE